MSEKEDLRAFLRQLYEATFDHQLAAIHSRLTMIERQIPDFQQLELAVKKQLDRLDRLVDKLIPNAKIRQEIADNNAKMQAILTYLEVQ